MVFLKDFCGSFLLFMFCVCHVFLSVHCSFVVTCWERSILLALLKVMVYCVFVILPCGVLGQVWCLSVSIPDLRLLSYFKNEMLKTRLESSRKSCLTAKISKA